MHRRLWLIALSGSLWLVAATAWDSLFAQGIPVHQGSTHYPWRATGPATGAGAGQAVQPAAPAPPQIAPGGSLLRMFPASTARQDEQQPATGGGVARNLNDDVPEPPSSTPVPAIEQRPALSVRSNATDPDDAGLARSPGDWCCLGEVQRLVGTLPNGLTVGGFSQNGWHSRDILGFNNRSDEFNSHQNWLYVGREADAGCGRPFGFRIDGLYGIDAQEIQATGNSPNGAPTGWDNSWDNGSYGWALPQAYIEFANCMNRVKIGKFLSPIGFESVPSSENFFYSRTYARTFTEPFSHTGLLVERDAGNGATMIGGLTAGWNTGFDRTDNGFNGLAGVRFRPRDRFSLGLTSSFGDTGYRGSGVLQTATAEVQLAPKVTWGLQGDFLNLQSNDELGLSNYLFYCHNRCLAFGTRLEWWKSDQFFGSSTSTWDWTIGANYRPHANVVIRPEIRADWGAAALSEWDPAVGIDAVILF